MHGQITEEWADGTYTFKVGYGQWMELDRVLEIGPMALYVRLLNRQWRIKDLREVIRNGLIGGGTDPNTALRLVKTYVEDRPLLETLPLALRVIEAALTVPEGARKPGEAEAAPTDTMSVSTSQPPTETLQ